MSNTIPKKSTSPLSILWDGLCTIYEYREETDPDTFQTNYGLVSVVVDEPCRLSQSRVAHNQSEVTYTRDGAPYVDQLTVLFIRPELDINAGSVIEVTQHGRTVKYKRSSEPAIYSNHQEIVLELYEDNA